MAVNRERRTRGDGARGIYFARLGGAAGWSRFFVEEEDGQFPSPKGV